MQLCDTGRDICWSITQNLAPDHPEASLSPNLSDEHLDFLLDCGLADPIETYPVALQEVVSVTEPVRRAWQHDLFWLLIGGVFALIGAGVTMLIGNLWR